MLSSLAADQTAAREEAGNADDLGWNDLDYYGSWYNVPGYGMAWAPDNAGADFDPYGSGYWGYYTNVGYSWISAYPWGWLPYHCGQWNYFSAGAGWLWLPGVCGPRHWAPVTPVRRGPPGYHPPIHPVPVVAGRYSLVAVNRTAPPAFRLAGEPKPMPRRLAIANDTAQPVFATPYPTYSVLGRAPGARRRPTAALTSRPPTPGEAALSKAHRPGACTLRLRLIDGATLPLRRRLRGRPRLLRSPGMRLLMPLLLHRRPHLPPGHASGRRRR